MELNEQASLIGRSLIPRKQRWGAFPPGHSRLVSEQAQAFTIEHHDGSPLDTHGPGALPIPGASFWSIPIFRPLCRRMQLSGYPVSRYMSGSIPSAERSMTTGSIRRS